MIRRRGTLFINNILIVPCKLFLEIAVFDSMSHNVVRVMTKNKFYICTLLHLHHRNDDEACAYLYLNSRSGKYLLHFHDTSQRDAKNSAFDLINSALFITHVLNDFSRSMR